MTDTLLPILKTDNDWTASLTRRDSLGSPVDITNTTITSVMRRDGSSLSWTPTLIDGPSGTFDLSITRAQNANIESGVWEWDICYEDPLSTKNTETKLVYVQGSIT